MNTVTKLKGSHNALSIFASFVLIKSKSKDTDGGSKQFYSTPCNEMLSFEYVYFIEDTGSYN